MKLKHENYDRITVIAIEGDVTADDLEPLRHLIEERLAANTRDFVLDLERADFFDSKGLETLLWLQEQADQHLGQVRLAAVSENLGRILHITRLEHHFDSHENLDVALKSLR